jgi:hypothetical protein
MPLDYGLRSKPKVPRRLVVGGAIAAVAIVGTVGVSSAHYHRELAQEQGWVNAAAPCPSISADAYRTRYAAGERRTAFEGATLTRMYGHVMCADVDTAGTWGFASHPVCQFTSPNAIRVKTGKIEVFFEPGPGSLATITIDPKGVRCSLGGQFTLFHDPTN